VSPLLAATIWILIGSMALLVASLGMRVTSAALRDEFLHPSRMLRALFAIGIVMPLLTIGAVRVLALDPVVEVALVALSMSPLPPGLLLKHRWVDTAEAYSATLLLVAACCAVLFVPFWLVIAQVMPGLGDSLPTLRIIPTIGGGVVLPLLAGMTLRAVAPDLAVRLSPKLHRGAVLVLLLMLPVLLWRAGPAMGALVGNGTLATLAGFTLVGLGVGHWLGGDDPQRRAALALAAGSRHPALALAIATTGTLPRDAVVGALVWHLVIAALVGLPYILRERRLARAALPLR